MTQPFPPIDTLPIDSVMPELLNTLRAAPCTVLSAAPGAGKTTRVPLALLAAGFIGGRIVMLEPRRLAAVRAAQYMAQQLGEKVGERVGYRIRGDNRLSDRTRIEVVTEGILSRLIQADPALSGIGLLIFDEFHERSLQADLGLALARDAQRLLRDDLKLLVMSATLDGVAVSALLGDAPVVESTGRHFPVETVFLGNNRQAAVEPQTVQAVLRALRERSDGDILVFLPGQREIRRTQTLLEASDALGTVAIYPLFGEAAANQQQAALQPDPQGRRKIILATSIAETSLTIDGVCVVIDAGLVRTVRFDPRRGMAGLVTVPVSQATAEQRSGRAGRQRPGACYRLWSAGQHSALARFPTAEILHSDLMPLALELAMWGTPEAELAFLDPPPPAHLQQARDALQQLGAMDTRHRLTTHGRTMQALPVHPRYAHMLLRAQEHGYGALACDVAALLEERDLLRGHDRDADLYSRWQALKHGGAADPGARERVRQQAMRLREMIGAVQSSEHDDKLGLMLALCYPERVARRRDPRGERWQLASGVGASLPAGNALANQEWIAVADMDGEGRDARIFLAAALDARDLPDLLPELFFSGEETLWSAASESVQARKIKRFGAIVVEEQPLPARGEQAVATLCQGLRQLGWQALPLPDSTRHWLARAQWARHHGVLPALPDCSDSTLLATLEQWLAPFLNGISKRSQLPQVDWEHAIRHLLTPEQQRQLDQLVPGHLTVPTGSRIALDYSGNQPILAVRLQEMFGVQQTPCIANGTVPVLIHLLSPAKHPLAVTQDLASFWQNAYKEVRKDMRGQYKRHHWPENPLEAAPTRRTKAADDRARKS